MKKRKEQIKKIEILIQKNRYSRRKFIDSIGKTVALSSIASLGLISLLSCEKETLENENNNDDNLNNQLKGVCIEDKSCYDHLCGDFTCKDGFSCTDIVWCRPSNAFDCPSFTCTESFEFHLGGSGS